MVYCQQVYERMFYFQEDARRMKASQGMRRMMLDMKTYALLETAAMNKEDEIRELKLKLGVEMEPKEHTILQRRLEKLTAEAAVLRSRARRTRRALDSIEARERFIIEHLYVHHTPVLDIMEALSVEKSSFYRLRRRAAADFLQAMYGVETTPDVS